MNEIEGTSRPGAAGHRFGPGLKCTECGVSWDEHQQAPRACEGSPSKARAGDGVEAERSTAAKARDNALAAPASIGFPHR